MHVQCYLLTIKYLFYRWKLVYSLDLFWGFSSHSFSYYVMCMLCICIWNGLIRSNANYWNIPPIYPSNRTAFTKTDTSTQTFSLCHPNDWICWKLMALVVVVVEFVQQLPVTITENHKLHATAKKETTPKYPEPFYGKWKCSTNPRNKAMGRENMKLEIRLR